MKRIIEGLVLGALFLFYGCLSKQTDEYKVTGSISQQYDGNMVMLFTLFNDSIISVDTAVVKNGTFRFQGKEYIKDLSVITTGNFPDKVLSTEIILERGEISVHLDSVSVVSGPLLQPVYKCYQDSLSILNKEFEKTYLFADGRIKITDDSAHNKAYRAKVDHALRVIKSNVNNAIGKRAFGWHIYQMTDEELYNIYDLFDESTKIDPHIVYLINDRHRAKAEYMASQSKQDTMFEDFELLTADGMTKMISDYVGKSKYLFIDFWASWCGPCIRDIPYIKDVYDKYQEKGLNVLGISFDTDETEWKKAVEIHHIQWETVMAKHEKEIRNAYIIPSIPYGILLDDKGMIVEVNLRGRSLGSVITKYLD